MSHPDRYAQCDDTCTVDCGACKGAGKPGRCPAAEADLRERLLTVLEIAGPLSPSMEKRLGDALMAEISRLVAEVAEARRLRVCVECRMPSGRHWDTCPNHHDGRPTR